MAKAGYGKIAVATFSERDCDTGTVIYNSFNMPSLFPDLPAPVPGFTYIENFLTLEEEETLLGAIKEIKLHTFLFRGYEAKRRVASFGYDYNFGSGRLTKGMDIPERFNDLISRVAGAMQERTQDLTELLITHYPIGAVINWHRDAPPFEAIAGISLLADCLFRFRPHDLEKQTRRSLFSIPVLRRSLYLIRGEARTAWEHSIAPVTEERYSITIRTIRPQLLGG